MAESTYDVVVIGAGIAGLTAALYSARLGLRTLVVSIDIGGQLNLAEVIQNFPGFKNISGFELAQLVSEQAQVYGAEFVFDEVVSIAEKEGVFEIEGKGGTYLAEAVILAMGKAPIKMGVPGEEEFRGKGVSYCVVCDAPLFKGRRVALVGWGAHAAGSVSKLLSYASYVYWVFTGNTPASEELVSRLVSTGKVELVPRSKPVEVKGDRRVKALVVRNLSTGELRELEVDGVFVEMGYAPRTEFLRGFVELNEKGEVIVDLECRTSRPGVFAAGDVTGMPFKQAVIAAGMGACAALSAYNYLARRRGGRIIRSDWRHLKVEEEGLIGLGL